MAQWNWCRGPGCEHTLVEMPFAHCSLACESADREARKRPGPQSESTLSVRDAETTMSTQARCIANYDDQSGHWGKRSAEATRQLHERQDVDMVIRAHGLKP